MFTLPKFNRKWWKETKSIPPNTNTLPFTFLLGTDTSMKRGGVRLDLWL